MEHVNARAGAQRIYPTAGQNETVQTDERKPYTRREIVMIIVVIVVAALIIGNFNSTTEAIQTVSSGPLSISLNVVCTGFGEPTYYSSMDQNLNYTTYQYGRCLFGFWVSNGQPVNNSNSNFPTI
jgi:hypothetical protein